MNEPTIDDVRRELLDREGWVPGDALRFPPKGAVKTEPATGQPKLVISR
jgi:hypothetical protein